MTNDELISKKALLVDEKNEIINEIKKLEKDINEQQIELIKIEGKLELFDDIIVE